MKLNQKIFYTGENDKVVNFKEKEIVIDENYKYITNNPIYKFFSCLTYKTIATPYAFIAFKLIKGIKFHNSKILQQHKKGGYFIYANHTNHLGDGFCPGLICFPKKPHIIVDPSNVSIPLIGKFNKMWGAIPLPSNLKATKNFYNAIQNTLNQNNPIVIYPEAHLWPYYTKIRDFSSSSFRYPVKFNKPVFTFTTIYTQKKLNNKPKIEIYIDGPFYPNILLSEKERQQELRDIVYNKLCERASLSNYEYIKYIKRGDND